MPYLRRDGKVTVKDYNRGDTTIPRHTRGFPLRFKRAIKGLSRSNVGRVFRDDKNNQIIEVPPEVYKQVRVASMNTQEEAMEVLEESELVWQIDEIEPIKTEAGLPDVAGDGGIVYLQNAETGVRIPFDFLSRAGVPIDPRKGGEFYGLIEHERK